VSNIRILAEQRTVVTEHPTSFVLMGGIDYDQAPSVTVPYKPDYVTTDTAFSSLRALRGGKWSFLPGTANEINGIQKIANSFSLPVTIYTKNNASEENFKLLGSSNKPVPSVLHIATHGFAFATPQQVPRDNVHFFQEDKRTVYRQSEDPLTRAGLVMAGGNKVWSTGLPYSNHEDGILTAREVSDMNLRGCVLATLSACETGLGEIKGSEGVFGLQRAFKMAGVQYLIISLWKVPDDETAAFMELFYTNWLTQKLPIREAFRNAQTTMSKKYKPYQWAAFVLVE